MHETIPISHEFGEIAGEFLQSILVRHSIVKVSDCFGKPFSDLSSSHGRDSSDKPWLQRLRQPDDGPFEIDKVVGGAPQGAEIVICYGNSL